MSDPDRQNEARRRLAVAERFLETAKYLANTDDWRSMLDRAYYAMFHAASGLLASRGLKARSHQGVLRLVAQTFVRTGELDRRFYQHLAQVLQQRLECTYDVDAEISEQDAGTALPISAAFLAEVKRILGV